MISHIAGISLEIGPLRFDISKCRLLRRRDVVNGRRSHPELEGWQLLGLVWPLFYLCLAPEARVVAFNWSCLLRGCDSLHIGYRLS